MNMMDYLDWRGDITFDEKPLNEVDNLIFSTLAYLKMDALVSQDGSLSPTLAELPAAYGSAGYDQSELVQDPLPLLEKAAACPRYANVRARYYVNDFDAEKKVQFSAVCFCYAENETFVAFRGTDSTIVGWREDCSFSFSRTPGQLEAAAYLDRVASLIKGSLIVGGHSKGGNFAVYGAVFCNPAVRDGRITRVYSNDGPGFMRQVVDTAEYESILSRTRKIIPESSLVGILLSSREKLSVIRSSAKGRLQHDPYTWQVIGTRFVEADERSQLSLFMDDTFKRWVDTLSEEDLKMLFDTVFDVLEASGATTVKEINENKRAAYTAILRAVGQLDSASRGEVVNSLKKLFESGKDAAIDYAK